MANVLNLIAEYNVTGGTIGSGATYALTPTASNGGGLGANEVYDVRWMEIYDTVTGTTPDNVGAVVPVVDGTAIGQYLSLLGRYDGCMAPPHMLIEDDGDNPPDIWGASVLDALEDPSTWALRATGLKCATSIGAQITATGGAVANAIKIRFYGERYQIPDLLRQAGNAFWTEAQIVTDSRRGISLVLPAQNLQISKAGWQKMPGGILQSAPQINRFQRYAWNLNATTVNIPYSFDEQTQQVAAGVNQDMTFQGQASQAQSARILQRLGLRDESGNIKLLYLNIPGNTPSANVPYSGQPAGEYSGTTYFGWTYPRQPAKVPNFYALPFLPGGPQLLVNETAYIQALDNGASAAANKVLVAQSGVQIDKIPAAVLAAIPPA